MVYIMSNFYTKKKRLKAQGYADASIKECLSVKPDESKPKRQRVELAKKVADVMAKDNVLKHFPLFLKTYGGG